MQKKSPLASVLHVCMIFGLYNKLAEDAQSTFQRILKYSYNIFFMVVCFSITYGGIRHNLSDFYCYSDGSLKTEMTIKMLTGGLCGMAAVISTFVSQTEFLTIIRSIEARDVQLLKLGEKPNTQAAKTYFFGQITFLMLLWTYCFSIFFEMESYAALDQIFSAYRNDTSAMDHIYKYTSLSYGSKISQLHSVMFASLMLTLKGHFASLNNVLLKYKHDNMKDKHRLLLLKRMHALILNDLKKLNNIFSIPILFKCLDDFLLIFTCIYSINIGFEKIHSIHEDSFNQKAMLLVITTCLISFELVNILFTCEITTAESSKTGVVLHKLFISPKKQRNVQRLVRKFEMALNCLH